MDVMDAIFSRQSVSKVQSEPLPRALIEQLLAAAVQAPNHYRVRPWRFFVLSGDARLRLGDALVQGLLEREPGAPAHVQDVERARPLRAPVLIAVAVDPPALPKVLEIENVCAAAAAVQNMLLAATALGLGAIWRTGPAAYAPAVKRFFGLAPEQHLIGFVYLGYPLAPLTAPQRPSFEDRTTWLE